MIGVNKTNQRIFKSCLNEMVVSALAKALIFILLLTAFSGCAATHVLKDTADMANSIKRIRTNF